MNESRRLYLGARTSRVRCLALLVVSAAVSAAVPTPAVSGSVERANAFVVAAMSAPSVSGAPAEAVGRRGSSFNVETAQSPMTAARTPDVLVVVNWEQFTKTEFDRLLEAPATIVPPFIDGGGGMSRSQTLVDTIDRVLVAHHNRQLGYTTSDDHLQNVITVLRNRYGLDTDEKFYNRLRSEGLTEDELRQNLERQYIYRRVQLSVMDSITIDDSEVRAYYATHRDGFPVGTLEEARTQIVRVLATPARRAGAWEAYLHDLRAAAAIEWRSDELAKLYADGLAERAQLLR